MMIRGSFCAALTLAFALGAARADARCVFFLDGDERLVAAVRAELDLFADDPGPCLSLRAVVEPRDGVIAIDLTDELGRVAQRKFVSAAGAAAYLVSWSQRPLMPSAIELAAPKPDEPREPNERAQPRRFHADVQLAYVNFGTSSDWTALTSSLTLGRGRIRAGVAVQGMYGLTTDNHLGADLVFNALAIATLIHRLPPWVTLRGEAVSGVGVLMTRSSIGDADGGMRFGVRAAVGVAVLRNLDLEIGGGFDWLSPGDSSFGSDIRRIGHLDLGVRWIL